MSLTKHENLQSWDRSPYLRMQRTTNKTHRNQAYPSARNNQVQNTIPTLQPSIKPHKYNRNNNCRHELPLIPRYKNKHARSDKAQSGGRGGEDCTHLKPIDRYDQTDRMMIGIANLGDWGLRDDWLPSTLAKLSETLFLHFYFSDISYLFIW